MISGFTVSVLVKYKQQNTIRHIRKDMKDNQTNWENINNFEEGNVMQNKKKPKYIKYLIEIIKVPHSGRKYTEVHGS